MSVLAVKEFTRSIVAGTSQSVASQTGWGNGLEVERQVPKWEGKLGSRVAAIVGPVADYEERRMTMPRGGGTKRAHYRQAVWIHALAKDSLIGGDDFDLTLSIVLQAFRSANVPAMITDPHTQQQSWLREIGEYINLVQEDPVRLAASGSGLVHFFAELHVTVVEELPG